MANPNTANYPSSLPTDNVLTVATDSLETSLVSDINASVTSFAVTNTSFDVPALVRVDNELILILTVGGGSVTSCTRGFGGSTAASHLGGSVLSGNVFAWQHNQMAAEVIAIATQLGANGVNFLKKGTDSVEHSLIWSAGATQGGSASSGFNLPTTNPAEVVALEGSNTITAAMAFDDTTSESIQGSFVVPDSFTGTVDVSIWSRSASTSGNVVMRFQSVAVDAGETIDPAFANTDNETIAPAGTTNQIVKTDITGAQVTGWAQNKIVFWKLSRIPGDASDTMTGDFEVLLVRIDIKKSI